jgi:hypothetical protein
MEKRQLILPCKTRISSEGYSQLMGAIPYRGGSILLLCDVGFCGALLAGPRRAVEGPHASCKSNALVASGCLSLADYATDLELFRTGQEAR